MNIKLLLKSIKFKKQFNILVALIIIYSVFLFVGINTKAASYNYPDYTIINTMPGRNGCSMPPYNTESIFNNNWFCASVGWAYSQATDSKERLFIGDSITLGMYNQWRIDPKKDSVLAISGANVGEIYTALNQLNNKGMGIKAASHKQVIVMLGTNSYESLDENKMNFEAYYITFLNVLASTDFCVIVPPLYSSNLIDLQSKRRSQLQQSLKYWGYLPTFKYIASGANPKMKIVNMSDTGTSLDGGKHSYKKSKAVYDLGMSSQCR